MASLLEPQPKKSKTLDLNLCVICAKKLDSKLKDHVVRNPSKEGLEAIFKSCEQ